MVGSKDTGINDGLAGQGDLASRIAMRAPSAPAPAAPETIHRVDGPIESTRAHRGRPLMIGADEPPPARPMRIGLEEVSIPATREAPAIGEMDLVVTPLATPDDWHHFELALRRVPGVGALRIEYYRAGILKLRLQWTGPQRFAHAVANVPGYRVGILGEDRSTVQIRVVRA